MENQEKKDLLKKKRHAQDCLFSDQDDTRFPIWKCQDIIDAFDLQSVPSSHSLFWYLRKKSNPSVTIPFELPTDHNDKDWKKFPLLISGSFYDGTSSIPRVGCRIECRWPINKDGTSPSFYRFSEYSPLKLIASPSKSVRTKGKRRFDRSELSSRKEDSSGLDEVGIPDAHTLVHTHACVIASITILLMLLRPVSVTISHIAAHCVVGTHTLAIPLNSHGW